MTVHVSQILNESRLYQHIENKLIRKQVRADGELFLLDYTPQAQYSRTWDDETMSSRGLVLSREGLVVARPFKKFFNLAEHEAVFADGSSLPSLPLGEEFDVFTKMDGSLGICYTFNDEVWVNTRGSFISDQALWATAFFRKTWPGVKPPLDQTWLFEIIYPENRIVVDYKGFEGLVFLAVIDNATGLDLPIPFWDGPVVDKHDFKDFAAISNFVENAGSDHNNEEGFVVRFSPSSTRAKVKFSEYCRLHKIMTGVSTKDVYKYLGISKLGTRSVKTIGTSLGISTDEVTEILESDTPPLDRLMDNVPDEFYTWLKGVIADLNKQESSLIEEARKALSQASPDWTGKEFAAFATTFPPAISAMLFLMRQDRDYLPAVWKAIRPTAQKAYVVDVES